MIFHLVLLAISTVTLAISAFIPERIVRYSGSSNCNNAVVTVDGNPSTCCLTAESDVNLRSITFAWFQVDLGATFSVTSVTLANRNDGSLYLQNFTVLVSNTNSTDEQQSSVCNTFNNGSTFASNADISLTLVCSPNPLNGRYVTIKRRGGYRHDALSLCEIKIGVILSDVILNLQNLTTNQNGVYNNKVSNLAIDGNTETCAQPEAPDGSNGWWSIDLIYNYIITSVIVFNSNGGSTPYLSYFDVKVGINADVRSQTLCYNYNDVVPAGGNATLSCSTPLIGRYVSVFRNGGDNTKTIYLCELLIKGQLYIDSTSGNTSTVASSSSSNEESSHPTSSSTSTTASTNSSALVTSSSNIIASGTSSYVSMATPFLPALSSIYSEIRTFNDGDCQGRISGFKAAVIVLAILLGLTLTFVILLGVYIFKLRRLLPKVPKPSRSGLRELNDAYEKPQGRRLSEVSETYEQIRDHTRVNSIFVPSSRLDHQAQHIGDVQ